MTFVDEFRKEFALLDQKASSVDSQLLAQRVVQTVRERRRIRSRSIVATTVLAAAAVLVVLSLPSDGPGITRERAALVPDEAVDSAPALQGSVKPAKPTELEVPANQTPQKKPVSKKIPPKPTTAAHSKSIESAQGKVVPAQQAEELLAEAIESRGRGDLMRAAELLQRLRADYVGTSQATVAAMYLARDAARAGRQAEARRLFEATVSEQSEGPLAREALGRLIELSQGAEQKEIAKRYLKSYPDGPHAAMAQRALGKNP